MFDRSKADAACNFFEGVLKHTADEWYGQPFLLAPWQEQAISAIFGNVDERGRRIIEMAYLEVPKKQGKTELVAGLILLVLILEPLKGVQIYGAAAATRQALNCYRAACKMVEQSTLLKNRLRVLRGTNRIMRRDDPDSFYAAIAADGDMGDGVNPSVTIADEVHRWRTRKQIENWDVLSNGGITRSQTLTIAITTAGVQNESPLAWSLHEKTRRIKEGIVSDPGFYGRIFSADPEDDPGAESTWIKAMPSLKENGGFLDIEKVRAKYVDHETKGDLSSFRRYFLNLWDQKENPAIEMRKWDASAGHWKAEGLIVNPPPLVVDGVERPRTCLPLPAGLMERFSSGRRCWAGVDLSMTTDFSALVLLFEGAEPDSYDVLPFFYFPGEGVRASEKRLGVPLQQWAREGFLELSAGSVVDYRQIKARLLWAAKMFQLRTTGFDPWNSRELSTQLIEEGQACVEIPQSYRHLSEPTKKIIELVASGTLHHGGHPVLRWHAGCATLDDDGRDNVMFAKPGRAKSAARIDGMSGLANAMNRAIVDVGKGGSIYDREDVLSIGL